MMKLRRSFGSAVVIAAIAIAGLALASCQAPATLLKGHVTTTVGTHVSGIPVTVYEDTTDTVVAATTTDVSGRYAFDTDTLAPGTYRIRFGADTWWNGATDWTEATPVTLTADTATVIDTTAAVDGGSITGTVTDRNGPAAGILVGAFDPTTGQALVGTRTETDGTFTIAGLDTRPYTIGFLDLSGRLPVVIYGSSTTDPTTGTPVTPADGTIDLGTIDLDPLTVPGAPTNLTATPTSPGYANLTWDPPADDGGSPVTGYELHFYSNPADHSHFITVYSAGTSMSTSHAGVLSTDSPTEVTVEAHNSVGAGPTASLTFTANAPLGAPTNVTATPGNATMTVSWTPPVFSGYSPITGYTVTSSGGQTCTTTGDTSCTIGGLDSTVAYTFTVTATNAEGTGPASTPTRAVRPAVAPDAPTNLTVTIPSAGNAILTWDAPADDGGSPITSYFIHVNTNPSVPDGGYYTSSTGTSYDTSSTGPNALPTDSPTVVTLSAQNAIGRSTTTQISFVAATVPTAPTSVTAVPGDGRATVSWAAPASDGGSAVTGYTVASSGGQTCSTTGATTCTVTGLDNGTAVTFTVTATNANGTGATSSPSAAVTPTGLAGPPTDVNVTIVAPGHPTVTWDPPADDGGSPVTGYLVTVYPTPGDPAGYSVWATGTSFDPQTYGQPLLPTDTIAYVTVAAQNSSGTGPATEPVAFIPALVPDAPTAVTATGGDGQATVTWTAPASDGGLPVTGYTVTASTGQTCTTTDATTCTVTSLTNGTAVTFTVTATNAVGASEPSEAATAVPSNLPGAPTDVAAVAGDGQATVSWTAPATDGGSPITGYTVAASTGQTCTTTGATTCTVTGLTNGTAVTFTVTATNANGTSAPSDPSAAVTPATVPDAPTGVTATAQNAQATVSWTVPDSDGWSPITGYTVTASTGQTCQTTDATTCTVTDLTNGTAVTFTVTATNAIGTSAPSDPSAAVTPVTLPAAPTDITVTVVTPGYAIINWTAPTDDGGSPITGYAIYINPTSNPNGGSWTGGDGTPATTYNTAVTGRPLPTSTPITVSIAAVTAVGMGPQTTTTFFAANVPDAPSGVTATFGDGTASVSWTAPTSDGGTPITGYTVTASTGQTCTTTGATTCTVTGLTDGPATAFSVTATNVVGTGPASTELTTPDAPTDVTATPAKGRATVSWTAPADDGASTITDYTVTASSGQTCSTSGSTSCTVTGLTNGAPVTFTVTATNVAGTGPASAPSAAVTPVGVPDAPTNLTATIVTPGFAIFNWTAPADDGGDPILGYSLHVDPTPSDPNAGFWTGTDGPVTTFDTFVTGASLPTATTSSVEVNAYNSHGSGPTITITFVAATPPSAPGHVTAVPGAGQATVSWTAPGTDGGTAVTSYEVTSSGGQTCTTTDATTCVVTGLDNGTTYTFTVTATNAVGTSGASAASPAITPTAVPGAPSGVTATAGDAEATVSWTAPINPGASAITGYTVTSSDGQTCTTTDATTCVVTGLDNGTTYTFTVTATNAVGAGASSAPSDAVMPKGAPEAPTGVTTTPGDRTATVSWTAPASNGGSAVTGYTVTSSDGQTCTTTGTTTCTVTGLDNGTSYTFTVTATNTLGTGPASAPSQPVTPARQPEAPVDVTATPGNGQATVTWTAPASNGGSAITGYDVTSSGGQTCTTTGTTTCTVTGLTNDTAYTFTVTATNDFGTSEESTASAAVTPLGAPDAPTGVTANATTSQATVTWTAPASDGGSPITGYTVTSSEGQTCTTTGATTCTVTGLTNGVSYTFTVTATTAFGTSGPSGASPAVMPVGPPPVAPTNLTAVVTAPGVVTISWTAPENDGGSPITQYPIHVNTDPSNPIGGYTVWAFGTSYNTAPNGPLPTDTPTVITVTAQNAYGWSPEAQITITASAP